jgi:hypothetical protein
MKQACNTPKYKMRLCRLAVANSLAYSEAGIRLIKNEI